MDKPTAVVPGSSGRARAAPGGVFDALLLAASLLALCVDVYLLQSDYRFLTQGLQLAGQQPEVGEVRSFERSVRARSASLPVWREVTDGERVRDKDQIFTGEQSSAQIVFDDGAVVEIGENTLVVIRRGEETTRFDVRRGYLAARSGSKAGGLEIDIRGTRAKVGKGGELAVEADATGEASLTVLEGKAQVSSKGKTVEVAENQRGSLRQDGSLGSVQTLAFSLLSPARGSTVFFAGDLAAQRLQWASVAGVSRFRVDIALDPGMKKMYRATDAEKERVDMDLPEGTFYWRVAARNPSTGKEEVSESRRLVRVGVRAPALWEPTPGAEVHYRETIKREREVAGEKGATVSFLWERVRGAKGYRIQVATDDDFRNEVVERDVAATRFHSNELPPHGYFWRVQSIYDGHDPSPWSVPRKFEVRSIPLPGAPEAELPKNGSRLELSKQTPAVEFEWKPIEGARGYAIEISRSETFETVVAKEQSRTNRHSWVPTQAGRYYWRVRAVDGWNRATRFGSRQSVQVTGSPPELVLPEEDAIVALTGVKPRVQFRWGAAPFARRYLIEVAHDERFSKLIFEREVQQTEFSWEPSGPGDYFWRVRSLYAGNDQPLPATPRRFNLTEKPPPPPPEVEPRYELEAPAKSSPRSKKRGELAPWLQEILGVRAAFATEKEEPPEGVLRWKPSRGAVSYLVQIARDDDFERMVLQQEVKTAELEWKEAAPGSYYFRVAAIDADRRRGGFSQTSEILVRPPAPETHSTSGKLVLLGEQPRVSLSWQPAQGVSLYEVELVSRENRSKTLVKKEIEGTSLEVESLESGVYLWRVRGSGGDAERTRFSEWTELSVLRQRPPPIPADLGGKATRVAGNKSRSQLTWDPVQGAVEYEVQVAKSSRFSSKDRTVATKKPELAFGGKQKGYWRVRARDRHKQWGPWSEPQSLPEEPPTQREIAAVAALPGLPRTSRERAESSAYLQIRAGFSPALDDYQLRTNVPTAFYSGPTPVGFSVDTELSWISGWRARAYYRQLRRTVFETAASAPSTSQPPVPLVRHQARLEGGKAWPNAFGMSRVAAGFSLGLEGRDVIAFRNSSSVTLAPSIATAALVTSSLQAAWRATGSVWLEGEARYGYPFLVRGFNVSSPLNLAFSARLAWEAATGLSLSLGYTYEINRFQFEDFNPLSGGSVAGTIKDDRQCLLLTVGYRWGL